MNVINLTPEDARYLAVAMHVVSKHETYTPALAGAALTVLEDGRVSATASDRYALHHVIVPQFTDPATGGKFESFTIFVPNEGLQWLYMHTRFAKRSFDGRVEIALAEPATVRAPEVIRLSVIRSDTEFTSVSINGLASGTKTPDFAGLLERTRTAETAEWKTRVRPDFLGATSKLGRVRSAADMRATKKVDGTPGPVFITFDVGEQRVAEALVQPQVLG